MLISNTKEGRKDGSYTRLFGNEDLGALISRVHSASISSGNELEKIIELKDGDTFDTKKAKGEKQNLINFQNNISNKIPYTTSIYICSFNQENKDLIKAGMKNEFDSSEIMTGKEFCQLLNINYDKILERRKNDQKKNIQFFLSEINRITKK